MEAATCVDDPSCRSQISSANLNQDQCYANKYFSSLQYVFPAGTHTVLLLISSPIGCGGRLTTGCVTWGSAAFKIIPGAQGLARTR
jgi:hypothetical protein